MSIEKPANNQHPIHDPLRRRWSPRAFANRPVEPEKQQSLFEAARWAPSSRNKQPWHFIIATRENTGEFECLSNCLSEHNMRWAKEAPVLILSVAELLAEADDRPNRYALHDVGLAVANLVVQATALDLYTHQMGGFDRERARAVFDIPQGHEPVTVIAVGYLGDVETLPDALRERELASRAHKPLEMFVFSG